MASSVKSAFLNEIEGRFGPLKKLGASQSLFEVANSQALVYVRYSRLHEGRATFYGLRQDDLLRLEGLNAFIVFLWDSQGEPLFLPLRHFSEVFRASSPAADGQYKVQVLPRTGGTELYVARAGRYNVEAYVGWQRLEEAVQPSGEAIPDLGHAQVQTLLGGIGHAQGSDIWIPPQDRLALDWALTPPFQCRGELFSGSMATTALQEIDVVWIRRGGNQIEALYEVEHTTPIYSGLLRFNDVKLHMPGDYRLAIVSAEDRRQLFARQVYRPTFRASGLSEVCQFMSYADVFRWHDRVFSAIRGTA